MKRLFSYLVMAAVIFPAVLTTSCDNEDDYVDDNPKEFTVSFDSNEGSAVPTQTIKNGEKVLKPDDPIRSGFLFSMWCKDVGLTTEWRFNTDVVTADVTLYAKWIAEKPAYNFKKEKVYFATIKGYRDEIKTYYYQHSVTQTNPNISVTESIIKFKEDSINNIMFIAQQGQLVIPDIGIEINGNSFDRMLRVFASSAGNGINFNSSYISLGRVSLLNLFSKGRIEGHITTFEDKINVLSSYLWSRDITVNDETWSMAFGDTPEYGLTVVNGFDYKTFLYNKNIQLPEVNIKEYLFVYDRFDDRNFTDDKGNSYTTKVVIKKLTDINNFDVTAKYPSYTSFQSNKFNPVIQLFKGEELIFEGKIEKYAEEWDTNGFLQDKTRTNIEFRATTLKDKKFYEIQYFSYYSTYFQIRGLDFTNPDPGEDFSTKYNEIITIVDDNKNNDKKTVSFE